MQYTMRIEFLRRFCQKIGDMFWERNDGLMKAPPLPINSTNLLTSATVVNRHIINQLLVIKLIIKNFTTKKTTIHLCQLDHMCRMNCHAMNIMGIAQSYLQFQTKMMLMDFQLQQNRLVNIKFLPLIKRLLLS